MTQAFWMAQFSIGIFNMKTEHTGRVSVTNHSCEKWISYWNE